MRRLLINTLIFCACACSGQALRFSEPTWDYTALPNASTTLLMHFENDYTDLGGGTWQNAANGWNGFASDAYKFGSYSAYHQTAFNTIQHYFYSTTATEAVEVGAGDFTLEFWAGINVTTNSGSPSNDILSVSFITGAAGAYFRVYNTYSGASYVPGLRFLDSGGTNFSGIYTGHGYFSGLNWFHCCFERRSGTLYGYVNGQQVMASAMAYEPVSITEVDVVAFNRTYLAAKFYIDELRVFKGDYVYGGEFTPPTRAIGLQNPFKLSISGGEIKF